jgi:hypothetical protein
MAGDLRLLHDVFVRLQLVMVSAEAFLGRE